MTSTVGRQPAGHLKSQTAQATGDQIGSVRAQPRRWRFRPAPPDQSGNMPIASPQSDLVLAIGMFDFGQQGMGGAAFAR